MSETQRIKIKRKLLLLLDFYWLFLLLIPPKLLRLIHSSSFFIMMHPLTKSFLSKITCLVVDFFLKCFSFFLILSLDIILCVITWQKQLSHYFIFLFFFFSFLLVSNIVFPFFFFSLICNINGHVRASWLIGKHRIKG